MASAESRVPERMWEINDRRLELFNKRLRRELADAEEREYKRLSRKVNEFMRKTWPEDVPVFRMLGRSPFTDSGRMIQIVRERNRHKRNG